MTKGTSSCTALVVALVVALPAAARAEEERKSPLADAPAVRRRVELRDKRFEIGVGAGSTFGQSFYNAVTINGRIGFHITDWLSIAGWGSFTPDALNFPTAFNDRLTGDAGALPEMRTVNTDPNKVPDRAPDRDRARNGMNKIGEAFALQLELVPFTGKFGLFSKLFMNYDFYLFGGGGGIDFKSAGDCDSVPVSDPVGQTCPVTGMKLGPNFGLGMHLFANEFFAINIEVRDLFVRNNAAGRDMDGDRKVDDNDMSWGSNIFTSLNLTFFLPGRAAISP